MASVHLWRPTPEQVMELRNSLQVVERKKYEQDRDSWDSERKALIDQLSDSRDKYVVLVDKYYDMSCKYLYVVEKYSDLVSQKI